MTPSMAPVMPTAAAVSSLPDVPARSARRRSSSSVSYDETSVGQKDRLIETAGGSIALVSRPLAFEEGIAARLLRRH
ncbi:Uncharacterised protein [Mycobacteroides abscessus subsp. massiliense]|nr:Uncharacterised protein [Mycobacteroides abscessus subsp. massiliense]SLD38024.1 Uncharacterised protein [Mycobacteroides abscessus subsp. massiliense]